MTRKSFRSLLYSCAVTLLLGLLLSVGAAALAQSRSSAAPQAADAARFVTLQGNTHPLAQPQFDRGAVPASMPAERLLLVLRRSPDAEAALQTYLDAVQNPRSPLFRKFITPDQFGKLYGPPDKDLNIVQAWLHAQGFTVNQINKGRTAIEFSGTAGQVGQAFRTSIHRYLIGGESHLANATDPVIPAALAPLVAGVASLHDFRPRPNLLKGPTATWNPAERRFQPDLTVTSGGSHYLFLAPGDAATIYDTPTSMNATLVAGHAQFDGSGVTIGIAGDTDLDFTGLLNYRSLFGLPPDPLTIVYDGNYANLPVGADQTEAFLDTEISGALAPGAHINYYTAGDTAFQSGLFLAIYRAIDDNNVNILSVSFGACEQGLGAAGNLQVLNAWQQAAAQGIAVTVSTGDSGSAGCDNPNTETVATQGLAVNGLASTPYNIAVGGTDFDVLKSRFSSYASATNGVNYNSALSYIPENPWNNSTDANGNLNSNFEATNSRGQSNIVGGGGGVSSYGSVDALGNQSPYPKPAWQRAFPLSATGTARDLPDVSLLAANGAYGATWAVCGSSNCTGANPTISGVGGTSASAPAFAGILALVNQKMGASNRLGQANWVLYQLAQKTPSAFHQVTTGNISVYCAPGSPDCAANSFLTGYNAGTGYNFATGLGSVDVTKLIDSWDNSALASTQTVLSLDKTVFTHGDTVQFTATVNPAAATGDVSIVNNAASQPVTSSNASGASLPLAAGSAAGSYTHFPGGAYNVFATYGGDGSYAGSTSTGVGVTVAPEDSIVNLQAYTIASNYQLVSLAGQTVPLGTFVSLNAQPYGKSEAATANPASDATGQMVFYDAIGGGQQTSLGNTAIDSTGNAEVNTVGLKAGAHSLTAIYDGDRSYNPSQSAPLNFTVALASTTLTLTSSSSSIFSGGFTLSAVIHANLPSGALQPYGAVTYTDTTNNTVLGTSSPAVSTPCAASLTLCLSVPLDVNVSQLTLGPNSIVASYSGDSNFLASGPTAPFTVNCVAGCGNGTGQTIYLSFYQMTPGGTIGAGGTITTSVDVSPNGGFTGAVNLSCSVAGKNAGDSKIPTCSFNPAQVTVANGLASASTLTIKTTAPATTSAGRAAKPFPWSAPATAAFALLLFFGLPTRRARTRAFLAFILLFSAFASVTACGGGGGGSGGTTPPPVVTPGTTPDIYTITFNAVDAATGTVTAQDYFNITVN